MSNYVSRLTKTLFSFLPFCKEGEGDKSDCGNCEHCNPRVKCRAAGKRKLQTGIEEGDEIPEKKPAKRIAPPPTPTEVKDQLKRGDNSENLPNSQEVQLQIVQNLNQLAKVMLNFAEDVAVYPSLDNLENGDSSMVTTKTGLENEDPSITGPAPTVGNGGKNVSPPLEPPNPSSTPTGANAGTPQNDENQATSDEKVEEAPEKSETVIHPPAADPNGGKKPPVAPTPTVVDSGEAEKAKVEENLFIKVHEVVQSGSPGPLTFSSPELAHHNLQKHIEFLQENVITPLKFQALFESTGLVVPKGVYFYGPGVVSSALLITKALATELSAELGKTVRLFRKVETDVFSKYGDDWTKWVPNMFSAAVKHKPSIILIEDIDVVCNYCEHGISSNTGMINSLGAEMGKILPGEVLVILTLRDLKKSFPALRSHSRFQKYLDFPEINSISSIFANLKGNAAKWTKNVSPCQEKENDKILNQVAENIFKATPVLNPEDVAQLCREVYQKSIQTQLASLSSTTNKPCNCSCCVSNLSAHFPALVKWEHMLSCTIAVKKATIPKDRYASLKPAENAVEPETFSPTLSFAQVGGLSKQIEILKENILVPLKNKAKLKELGWGVEPVRGFIFHGPPGTGKTLLGKALAAELSRLEECRKFSFVYHKGTECHGMYVGQTEGKLREIFENAAKKKPAIIFLDEIDGLCSARTESGNSRFYNGVVTTILGLMDNVPRGEVFVIAATNRLSALDPALRRPGRFDKCVEFQAPKFEGRKNILEIHTSTWKEESKLSPSLLDELAEKTGGYTGADLEQLCRQAFVFAMRRHSSEIAEGEGLEGEKQAGLDKLCILADDGASALRVVKPSGGNYFGNEVISDKPIPKLALAALQGKLETVAGKLSYFLEKQLGGGEKCGGLNTFLVWGNGPKQQKVIDNLFVPSLISSKSFSSTVAVKLHLGMTITEMSAALQHILNPGEDKLGILYIPNVDQLLDPSVDGHSEVKASHRKFLDELERLRGEMVLVLGTSGKKPSSLSQEVQTLFRDVENTRRYEFKAPSNEEIRLLFEDVAQMMAPSTHAQLVKILSPSDSTGRSTDDGTDKNVSIYDLLDFKVEVERVLKRFEGEDEAVLKDGVDVELGKLIEAFGKHLPGDEKFKSSIRGMYT